MLGWCFSTSLHFSLDVKEERLRRDSMLSEDSLEGESAHFSITLAYNAERREIGEQDLWICKYWLAWYSLRMLLCGLKSPTGFKKPEYLWNASEGLQVLKSFWDMRQRGEVQRQWCCSTPLTQDKQQDMTGYKSGVGLHHVEEFRGEEWSVRQGKN